MPTAEGLPVFYVYVLYHDTEFTRPFYVGKGKGRRVRDHTLPAHLRRGDAKALIVRGLLDTLGFVPHRLIEEGLSEKAALALEKALIKAWGMIPNGPLANLAESGSRGHTGHRHSPKTRARLSQLLTGKKQSEATKAKRNATLSKMFKGKIRGSRSSQTRSKRAASMTAFWATSDGREKMSKAGMRGRHHLPESRAKISASNRARVPSSKDLERYRKTADRLLEWRKRAGWPGGMSGKMWITDGKNNRVISGEDTVPDGWAPGMRPRSI